MAVENESSTSRCAVLPVNWNAFSDLPGSGDANFENLCRALIRYHFARYGDFCALAAQPGVEFHLNVRSSCSLGDPGRWYGWQCRWYDLPSGRAIGSARRKKIEKAIRTTEKMLPDLTDWVLWTRNTLTSGDQKWFYALKTKMRLHLWTAIDVESYLTGEAEILRRTYFGELILTPVMLADIHQRSVAPIRARWQPEVHQVVDAERALRRMLGKIESWEHLRELGTQLRADAEATRSDQGELDHSIAEATTKVSVLACVFADALFDAHTILAGGDLDLLRQELMHCPTPPNPSLGAILHQLRAARSRAALSVTNALADTRLALQYLDDLNKSLGKRIVAVLSDAGGGKTQLAAQLTAPIADRPAGLLLLGSELHANHSLDDLARRVVIQGVPAPSMEALVAALNAAGQRTQRRMPIVIDGLNEAEDPRRWKSMLATLNETLRSYAYVLVVCTVRPAFADETLPEGIERLEIPDFARDTIDAIKRYFAHYRISATDADLPIQFLKHPLTLRLFCEVTNPTRQRVVGIEAMPQSLTGLFDEYLKQGAERIAQLAPRTRRYYEQDVREALDEIGILLWQDKARSLELTNLQSRLGDTGRPWNESLVHALEQESILARHPGEASGGSRVAGVYDALAGHLVANAILVKYGQAGIQSWLNEPSTVSALRTDSVDQHPLAADIFRALVGLIPRRLHRQQLWTFVNEPLRSPALRGAADLEGAYLDAVTVQELSKVVPQAPIGIHDLLDRLWQTRGSPDHPLNADFLDGVLRSMGLAARDLRWTEWARRHHENLIQDVRRIEERWRRSKVQRSVSDRLRARWLMWMLTSTVPELRDRATRALYWFGRRNPAWLFQLTLEAVAVNDPYVCERMLAAAYGVCMAHHSRPKRVRFRAKLLPAFAKGVYSRMFAPSATYSTTHALSRDFARRIIDLAFLHTPSILDNEARARMVPPFKDGGIRQWGVLKDPNKGNYREGNSPLGMDFENYTLGGLVPKRRNYDFDNKEHQQVVGQIVWRLYQLGYSLQDFGEIDKEISRQRYLGRGERPIVERYGKKYARIAYFELYGFRKDGGLLEAEWYENNERPSEIDIDPSFPESEGRIQLIEDLLGTRSRNTRNWVQRGPTPEFQRYLVEQDLSRLQGQWLLLDGSSHQRDKAAERIGFVSLRSLILLKEDVKELVRLIKTESPGGGFLPRIGEDHYTFAGEIPWCETFSHNELCTIDFTVGKVEVPVSPNDPRYIRVLLRIGDIEQTIGPTNPPQFEQVNVYKRIPVYVPVRQTNFPSSGKIERPSCTVPAKELADYFRLWLNLPSWNMHDPSGRQCSIAVSRGAGEFVDYEHHLFFRKELMDEFLAKQHLALVWVVWGERQHFSERRDHSYGYKYFRQVYRYVKGRARCVA
jgi:hypothetical protein